MKSFFLTLVVLAPVLLSAQFSVSSIPDSLTKDAHAVKRYQEVVFEIKSPAKAILHEREVYTVLDETGDPYGDYFTAYDKFIGINSILGILYDKNGKEIKRVKKKDLADVSSEGDGSLITDTRYKINRFYYKEYPYTVDYQEDDEINGIRSIDEWLPQSGPRLSVQESKYSIIAPKNYVVRFKEFNIDGSPVITESGDKKIYTWEIKNLPAKTKESYAPAWNRITPFVMFAPSEFEAEGYKGDMTTWKSFGSFMYQLIKGRDVLPEDIKAKVHQLTDGIKDEKQKIAVLYDFLQKNTRYISIQFGIGGWQPFNASEVAFKRYGDCKALSNYMVALLKEAGIQAKNVIIRAEENAPEVVSDFSCSQFNHMIACVPMQNDTVWLECTDHELPAGYLSGFTANRWGLLVDETGGTLVRTPKYGINDNVQVQKISATVNNEGNVMASVKTLSKAEMQDDIELDLEYKSKEELLKKLKTEIDLPTYDITKFDYKEEKLDIPPVVDEAFDFTASNYAQVSGKRLFIEPNILNRSLVRLKTDDTRKYSIHLNKEYKKIDSVEIDIPDGYDAEAIPEDKKIESSFGKYFAHVKVMPNKILYYRYQEQFSGIFPAKSYQDMVKYYEDVYKADRAKIVLVKKE